MIIESQNPLLSPESSSGFWLHGRHLSLMAAIKREDAESKKISDGRNAKILDKRNIYLIKEGFIRSDSNAAKLMPASELSKRHQSYYDRKRKLERFPHLFVSKTRLSIRNLPKSVDESALKELAKNAAHEWTSKMSEMAKAKSLGRSEKEEWEELVAGKIMGPVFVRQAKIIRDDSRVELKDDLNSSTPGGKKQLGQSKGYGFVEFSKHSHALAFLRQLNNNPSVFPNSRRLLIEFAIENSNTLSKRHARFTKNRDDQKQKKPIVKDPVQPKKSDSQKVKKPLKHAEKIEKKSIAAPSSQGTVDKYRQKLKTTDNWLAAS